MTRIRVSVLGSRSSSLSGHPLPRSSIPIYAHFTSPTRKFISRLRRELFLFVQLSSRHLSFRRTCPSTRKDSFATFAVFSRVLNPRTAKRSFLLFSVTYAPSLSLCRTRVLSPRFSHHRAIALGLYVSSSARLVLAVTLSFVRVPRASLALASREQNTRL